MKSFSKYFVLGALMALPVIGLAGGPGFGPDACSFPKCCSPCHNCHTQACCNTGCTGYCPPLEQHTCLSDCALCFP